MKSMHVFVREAPDLTSLFDQIRWMSLTSLQHYYHHLAMGEKSGWATTYMYASHLRVILLLFIPVESRGMFNRSFFSPIYFINLIDIPLITTISIILFFYFLWCSCYPFLTGSYHVSMYWFNQFKRLCQYGRKKNPQQHLQGHDIPYYYTSLETSQ